VAKPSSKLRQAQRFNRNGPPPKVPPARRWTFPGPNGERRGVVLLPGTSHSDVLEQVIKSQQLAYETGVSDGKRRALAAMERGKKPHPKRAPTDADLVAGGSVPKVAEKHHLSPHTVRRWQRTLRAEGKLPPHRKASTDPRR